MREDVVNGKCYCGTPKCVGTLFPRIVRDEGGSDEEGNEGEEEENEQEGGIGGDEAECASDEDNMELDR